MLTFLAEEFRNRFTSFGWRKFSGMVEVFQTNVEKEFQARIITAFLMQHFPESKVNFDLDDCDRILRIEAQRVCPLKVTDLMKEKGFHCMALE
jgi:hypothetical protein